MLRIVEKKTPKAEKISFEYTFVSLEDVMMK